MKTESYKTYVGADLHKAFTQFNAQTQSGKETLLAARREPPGSDPGFSAQLPGPVQVAVEATSNAAWFCGVVRTSGHAVMMAHPRETRARAGTRGEERPVRRKDPGDAPAGNLIRKQAWQAPEDVLRIRERLRHMQLQTRTKTAHKNKVHSILIRKNIRSPHRDAFCKKGRVFLANLDLPEEYKTTIERCIATIEMEEAFLKEDIAYRKHLVETDEQAWFLTTIPGINVQLAALIRYETGDIRRFERAEAYVNYTGLVPGKEQSAEHSRNIGITKEGSSWLRWAFVEAAQSAPRQKGRLSRFYWRHMMRTKKHGVAVTATAREIAVIAYHIMQRGQGYYEPLPLNKKAS